MRRLVLTGVAALACGCSQRDGDWRADAKFLKEAGFRGEATIIYGSGHVGGQAFNLTGSSGVLKFVFDPRDAAE